MPRDLAIGDIHGCYTALTALCEFVGLRDDDTIVTLGDYPNRGPDTKAVLDWLIEMGTHYDLKPLRGNHDLMMVQTRETGGEDSSWIDAATLRSYSHVPGKTGSIADIPDAHWDFLINGLLPYYETDTHFFVHANAYPDIPLADQPEFMLYWESFENPPQHESGKIMVCGHTSQKTGLPVTNGHAVCIDTWASGSGWLSCLDVAAGIIWQANQRRETRRLSIDEVHHVGD